MKLRPSDPPTMLAATLIIQAAAALLTAMILGGLYVAHNW